MDTLDHGTLASTAVVPDLLDAAIAELGYQPFLSVDILTPGAERALICATQNDAEAFASGLTAWAEESDFLRGLCAVLGGDAAGAQDHIETWLRRGDVGTRVSFDLPTAFTAAFPNCVGYPLIRIGGASEGTSAPGGTARAAALSGFVRAFADATGNDFLREHLCVTLALALARFAEDGTDADAARQAVETAVTWWPESPPLRAALARLIGRDNGPQPEAVADAQAAESVVSEPPVTGIPEPSSAGDHTAVVSPSVGAAELLYQRIREIGHQPLFALLIGAADRTTTEILICRSASDVVEFIRDARGAQVLERCRFLRAFVAALEHEVFDAGTDWFDWIEDPHDPFTLVGEFPDLATQAFPNANGYPLLYLFEAEPTLDASADPLANGELLGRIFAAFEGPSGNEAVRDRVLEGMALALSKHLGHHARYGDALVFVKSALQHAPKSIHLKAAENALERRLAGEAVPARLVKFIDRDNGALRDRICDSPFRRFDIGPSGETLVCCGHWLPTSIGNVMTNTVDEVLNSPTAQRIRGSMLDGTFKYCNHLECGWMVQDVLPRQDEVRNWAMRAALDHGKLTVERVDEVLFAFDQTCNLSCPSCRTHRITEKPSENQAKADAIERNLLPLLPRIKLLYINPAGEFLASKPSRRLLELIDRETCPNLRIELISNGTLFTPSEWAKFPNIHDMVVGVRISVDGCTKESFESLRRLGKFDVFCRNMEFLGGLRASGILPSLKFSFTYQLGNFREMADFVRFARGYHCDFAIFERLQNLGAFTDPEFRARAVHLSDHPLHQEFLSVIRDPIFQEVCVWHDFEWPGTTSHHTIEARTQWNQEAMKFANNIFGERTETATA